MIYQFKLLAQFNLKNNLIIINILYNFMNIIININILLKHNRKKN